MLIEVNNVFICRFIIDRNWWHAYWLEYLESWFFFTPRCMGTADLFATANLHSSVVVR